MKELISLGAPIEVMVEFFSPIPRFDEDWTRDMLTDLIGRQYSGFVCEKVWLEGPQFCLGPECSIYRRSDDDFKSYST